MIRKKPSYDGRQQVTRIPPYRPGDWVKLKELEGNSDRAWGLSGRALRVRSGHRGQSGREVRWLDVEPVPCV